MKLRTKIVLAFVAISVLSVLIIGTASITMGRKSMQHEAFEKLTAIRELKANHIESYFEEIRDQLTSFSEDYMVIDAMEKFHESFHTTPIQNTGKDQDAISQSLNRHYKEIYLPKLASNAIEKPEISDYFPNNKLTQYYQYIYLSDSSNNSWVHELLNKSKYGHVHNMYHPVFEKFAKKFGYYDIFLIDTTGHIVYTVGKEIDFATSIEEGAFNETNLAMVAKGILNGHPAKQSLLVDFDFYEPSFNEQASFIAAPIYKDSVNIGVLCFQLPIDRINNIMTDNHEWQKVGLGKTGETYIVGDDSTLRNQSRFLIEDKEEYISILTKIGTPAHIVSQISNFNNSIGLQKVITPGVEVALNGSHGTDIFRDYRGIDVLSSYMPLQIQDVNWVIMSELDKSEAFSAISQFIRRMLLWSIFLILIIPLIALLFSYGLTKPLVELTKLSRKIANGNLDIEVNQTRSDEIGLLAKSMNSMKNSIRRMMSELQRTNDSLEEKVELRTREVNRAHEQVKSIFDNANDAIITVDENQNILLFNPSACSMFGYEENDIIGKSLLTILPHDARKKHQEHIDSFKNHPASSKRMDERPGVMGLRKNGELFPVEASISKDTFEGKTQFTAFVKDITERRRLEEILAEENKRMEDELNVGKEIQMSMLPLIFPAFPDHSEFNIHALLESAREVGGDFYDFYFITENKFLFTIADVSGKGVPSALFMAVSKTLIKSRANEDDSPSSIVTFVNDELCRDNKTSMFVTLFLCIVDLTTGEVKYTNAGHNPPYLKRVTGEIVTLDTLHGPAVGAIDDFVYKEDRIDLMVNDQLILFTDGVNEAMNIRKQLFGNKRIIDSIGESTTNLTDTLKRLYRSVMEFQGEAIQADDITILGFEYLEPIIHQIVASKSFVIVNELSEIEKLKGLFNEFCSTHELAKDNITRFNIVLDELLNNIISYGYPDQREGHIEVKASITADQIIVSIEDDATAFNPLKMSAPDTELDIEKRDIGGLGVHMVRKLMDNISYKRFSKKNLTTIYKKRISDADK